MKECDMIRRLAGIHGSTPFTADAELFGDMLFSMDGFSRDEDLFAHTPPERIGHDMAAAACADLLACGVKPGFLLQTWDVDETEPPGFYERAASGVEEVLRHYGAKCIGGDTGRAVPWRWTAVVGARIETPPVRRAAARKTAFDLYLSGPVGDANLAAFAESAMPEIELRDPVPPEAIFATDTSGGFMDALENFRRVNPELTLGIDAVPVAAHPPLPFPEEFLLIGGAGEYELVFALPAGTPCPGAVRIGSGDFSGRGIRFAGGGIMRSAPPDYRDIPPENRLAETEKYYREVFS